eukprot:gnl/Hemi2/21508_TR7160_c0_g1_i1.p1 gnl/Hemi2/21508_TR7160_c0_g1~~gnl/Hemi2/21508_TR7160_c0_g1_i1.p1  ORF type:complete len:204 (+),score=54.62 gnl/Hemi2/21508_TR7160_c0_g1_i1:106-717(+)
MATKGKKRSRKEEQSPSPPAKRLRNNSSTVTPVATKKEETKPSSVIYVGHVPYGFFEKQMRGFFTQFGDIIRLRISRSRKTGGSRHYAFIEFADAEVAKIAAETMNNYLLFNQILVCKLVPSSKIHPTLFSGCKKKFKKIPWRKLEKKVHNKERTPEEQQKVVDKLLRKEQQKREKIAALGIDYTFTGYAGSVPPQATHVKFD